MLKNRWEFPATSNPKSLLLLQESLQIPFAIAKLLVDRGIETYASAEKYFKPQLADLHDPFLMEDMTLAVNRINQALYQNEKILIYGDYDVDGTTSVALVFSYLKKFTNQIEHYQPNRYTEGYGVSFKGVEYAKDNGFTLIIALDCGTKAVDKVAKAKEYDIDFIIADHHTAGEVLPDAVAILNPKKKTCSYPYNELCGCGIGFKLMQALAIENKYDLKEIFELLDLVAIAIGADIVPITGENRVLAFYGLKQVAKTKRIGIKTMLELANKKSDITISDLVFTIAPRINAAGRIDSARSAVELLLAENEETAKEWSDIINDYNAERKEIDKDITAEALRMIEENSAFEDRKSTVLSSATWHKGVVGIVASRLIEQYYKPTIILVESNGLATGSARSVKGFDVYKAIDSCSDLLERFGGHKYAAGLALKLENLPLFTRRFEEAVSSRITEEQLMPVLKIDGELFEEDFLNDSSTSNFPKIYRLLKRMAPFGPLNMTPNFIIQDLEDTGYSKIVGENHLKVSLRFKGGSKIFNGIGFGMGDKLQVLKDESKFIIVVQLIENNFYGMPELEFIIKDVRC